MKTDMPILILDDTQDNWFAWVLKEGSNGPTIGYVSSLPEAVMKANQMGTPVGYRILMSDYRQVSVEQINGSYQQAKKLTQVELGKLC